MMMAHKLEGESESFGQHLDLESQQQQQATTALLLTSGTSSTCYYPAGSGRGVTRSFRVLVYAILFQTRKFLPLNGEQKAIIRPNQLPLSSLTPLHCVALPIAGGGRGNSETTVESEVVTGSSSIDFQPALHDDHDDVYVDINLNEETNTSTLPDDGGGHLHVTLEEEVCNTTSTSTTTSATDAKRLQQYNNIANMVKTKNLESLHQFGGVQGIAEALNTNLEAGIPRGEQDLRSRTAPTDSVLPTQQATGALSSPSFFRFLLQHCNDVTILLLFIAAVLSIGFGMKEEGPKTGWYEGFFMMVGVIVLVFAPTLRDLWLLKRPQIFKRKPVPPEQKYIDVVRGNGSQCHDPKSGPVAEGEFHKDEKFLDLFEKCLKVLVL